MDEKTLAELEALANRAKTRGPLGADSWAARPVLELVAEVRRLRALLPVLEEHSMHCACEAVRDAYARAVGKP